MNVAEHNGRFGRLLAEMLAAVGLCRVVASPGSRNTPLLLGFHSCAAIDLTMILDERVAGFMALGLARAGQRAVGLLCTSGSAGAHYLPAIMEARHSRVPLVVITADRPPELQGCGAPQTAEQRGLFAAQVKLGLDLPPPDAAFSPHWLRSRIARAVGVATSGPPGPVHINMQFREPLWQPGIEVGTDSPSPARILRPSLELNRQETARLADALCKEPRGVVVCGPRHARDDFAVHVARLAECLGWPLLADPASQARWSGAAANSLVTTYDALLRDPGFTEVYRPSCVLRFGQPPTSKALNAWLERYGRDRTVLVDSGAEWRDPSHGANTLVVAEAGPLCRALHTEVCGHPSRETSWLHDWKQADAVVAGALAAASSHGFWEGAICRTVTEALPQGSILHIGSSMPIRDLDTFAPALPTQLPVFANRGLNGIDGTLSTALGEGMAQAGPILALCGDLAFLHDIAGLLTAQQLEATLTVVVINNHGGGIFENLAIGEHPKALELFVTPQAADLQGLCRAVGADYTLTQTTAELSEFVSQAPSGLRVAEAKVCRESSRTERRRALAEASEALHHSSVLSCSLRS